MSAKVTLIAYTPMPEQTVACAAKLCYSPADIETVKDGLDQEKAMTLLDGIYSTVVMRDILERERRRGRQITDPILLCRIILLLADNIGNSISAGYIHQTRIA